MRIFIFSCLALSVLLVSGCASTSAERDLPPGIAQAPPGNLQLADVANERSQRYAGSAVRWGGTVVDVVRVNGVAEVEVLERKIDQRGKPYYTSSSAGRFALRGMGATELEVGDDVTIVGRLAGFSERTLGNERRLIPLVHSNSYHRWAGHRRTTAYGARHHHHSHLSDYILPFVYVALIIGLGHHLRIHHHGHHHSLHYGH